MRRSLARGLSQILAAQTPAPREKTAKPRSGAKQPVSKPPNADAKPKAATGPERASEVAVDLIRANARQPRAHFGEEELRELADSIKEVGVLQPLIVRPIADGRYELIAGERRLRAARLAGLASVPVVLRSESNQGSLEIALIENLQREDISPLEAARAYQRLMDEFGLTQETVARKVGKSRPAVANSVRLLRLPQRIQDGLEARQITEGHARALLAAEDPALQLALYERILAKGLSVREVEDAIRPGAPVKASGPKFRQGAMDPEWEMLRSRLSERFGSPVKLQGTGGRGKLVIEFYSEDDLDRILESLGIKL